MEHIPQTQDVEPQRPTTMSRLEISNMARQSWATDAFRQGDDNSLWISAQSMWSSINIRYSQGHATGNDFVVDLHDLWFIYCHASMNTSNESACQDRLVLQILQAREQGPLNRRDNVHAIIDTASTPDGVIWTDLPYLVPDLTDFWITNYATMSGAQRLNISSFMARLASVGVADDKLCSVALLILRETLETARPMGQLGDSRDADPSRTAQELSIAALLPSANAWLFHAGARIVNLAEQSWNGCSVQAGELGDLLYQDPWSQDMTAGMSRRRWLFWLKRLGDIARETGNTAEYASRVMDNMLLTVDQKITILRTEVEAMREVITHQTPVQMMRQGPHEDRNTVT